MSKKAKVIAVVFGAIIMISLLSNKDKTKNSFKDGFEQGRGATTTSTSISQPDLLAIARRDYKELIGKKYQMTLYLDQVSESLSEGDFMTLKDGNSKDNILLKCKLSSSDVAKLDIPATVKGELKEYSVEFEITRLADNMETTDLYYNAKCSVK